MARENSFLLTGGAPSGGSAGGTSSGGGGSSGPGGGGPGGPDTRSLEEAIKSLSRSIADLNFSLKDQERYQRQSSGRPFARDVKEQLWSGQGIGAPLGNIAGMLPGGQTLGILIKGIQQNYDTVRQLRDIGKSTVDLLKSLNKSPDDLHKIERYLDPSNSKGIVESLVSRLRGSGVGGGGGGGGDSTLEHIAEGYLGGKVAQGAGTTILNTLKTGLIAAAPEIGAAIGAGVVLYFAGKKYVDWASDYKKEGEDRLRQMFPGRSDAEIMRKQLEIEGGSQYGAEKNIFRFKHPDNKLDMPYLRMPSGYKATPSGAPGLSHSGGTENPLKTIWSLLSSAQGVSPQDQGLGGGKPSTPPGLPHSGAGRIPKFQKGGIVTGPTLAMVGEAGPEAIIPLGNGGGGQSTANQQGLQALAEEIASLRGSRGQESAKLNALIMEALSRDQGRGGGQVAAYTPPGQSLGGGAGGAGGGGGGGGGGLPGGGMGGGIQNLLNRMRGSGRGRGGGGPGGSGPGGDTPGQTDTTPADQVQGSDITGDVNKPLGLLTEALKAGGGQLREGDMPRGPAQTSGGGDVSGSNRTGGGGAVYDKLLKAFQGSSIIGKVPKDGARFGIKTGSAEEYARFGTAVASSESSFNPKLDGPATDPGGSHGTFQYAHNQVPGGNAYDVDASIKAFVRDTTSSVNKGSLRGGILGARFSTIGKHPDRTEKHLGEAREIASGTGLKTSGGQGKVTGYSPYQPYAGIPQGTGGGGGVSGGYVGTGGFDFMGSKSAHDMGMDVQHGKGGLQWFDTGVSGIGKIQANKFAGPDMAGFIHDLHAAGAPLGQFNGTFNDRRKRGGSMWSQHAFANAVDIESGMGSGSDNSPALYKWAQAHPKEFAEIQERHHMRNLYSPKGTHDWGHFEWTPGRKATEEEIAASKKAPGTPSSNTSDAQLSERIKAHSKDPYKAHVIDEDERRRAAGEKPTVASKSPQGSNAPGVLPMEGEVRSRTNRPSSEAKPGEPDYVPEKGSSIARFPHVASMTVDPELLKSPAFKSSFPRESEPRPKMADVTGGAYNKHIPIPRSRPVEATEPRPKMADVGGAYRHEEEPRPKMSDVAGGAYGEHTPLPKERPTNLEIKSRGARTPRTHAVQKVAHHQATRHQTTHKQVTHHQTKDREHHIPAYQFGGEIPFGGMGLVGEAGPELVMAHDQGSTVVPLPGPGQSEVSGPVKPQMESSLGVKGGGPSKQSLEMEIGRLKDVHTQIQTQSKTGSKPDTGGGRGPVDQRHQPSHKFVSSDVALVMASTGSGF